MVIKLLELESLRRDAILNAALKEFVRKGFENASTNVIAREAGISKALMFHYVKNKQELFLCVYDYFTGLLDREYYMKMNFTEKDIFKRLRQSYLLQIELVKQYPWIFEFHKLTTKTYSSDEVNQELQKRILKKEYSCSNDLFEKIDETAFKTGLDIKKCKQIILWANVGFTNEILEDIRNSESYALNYDLIIRKLDGYLAELRRIFYQSAKP